MDDLRFDRLTRRLTLAGVGGGLLTALLGSDEIGSRKKSKRKRCRNKARTCCAGRCCPKRYRCQNRTCVQSCEDPFVCPDQGGAGCGAGANCFCSTSINESSVCVRSDSFPCAELQSCSDADSCPSGQICALCDCLDMPPVFRCKRPCPAG